MACLIVDTLIGSLTRLNSDKQKSAKTTAFDLQTNPANPGMGFHKLDQVEDKISGRCGSFFSPRGEGRSRKAVHQPGAAANTEWCNIGAVRRNRS